MEEEGFKIYADRLRDGKRERIEERFNPEFIGESGPFLAFDREVRVLGEAYLADEELVLHLDIRAEGKVPCSICNEPVSVPVEILGIYHAVPLEEVKTGVYDYRDLLREMLLLETPPYAECGGGRCAERGALGKFLKEESNEKEEGQRPFADLE